MRGVADAGQAEEGLRRRWQRTAAIYGAALVGGYLLIERNPLASAEVWLLIAGALVVVELVVLRRILRYNHAPGPEGASARLLPTFGYGTAITLVCGLLLALLAGFLFWPTPVDEWAGLWAWVPAILYTAARLLDLLDGYVARMTRHETKLGAILDIEFDGLGLLIAVLLAIQFGRVPVWYLPLAFSRQLFVAGMWLRTRRGLPVYDLPPSENRRLVAGFQTGFLTVMLWPVFEPPLTTLASALFGLALLASFGRDWLVVSGAVDAESDVYGAAHAAVKRWVEKYLPPAARIVGTLIGVYLFNQAAPTFAGWRATFAGGDAPDAIFAALLVTLGAAIPLFALGIMGRVAALGVIGLAFLDAAATGAEWHTNGLLACGVIVLHAGAGLGALWQPEEIFLHKRLGERPAEVDTNGLPSRRTTR